MPSYLFLGLPETINQRRGEITSRSITAVIEPYGKHFIEKLILPTTTSTTTFLVLIGNSWNDTGKLINGVCLHKNTLISRGLI